MFSLCSSLLLLYSFILTLKCLYKKVSRFTQYWRLVQGKMSKRFINYTSGNIKYTNQFIFHLQHWFIVQWTLYCTYSCIRIFYNQIDIFDAEYFFVCYVYQIWGKRILHRSYAISSSSRLLYLYTFICTLGYSFSKNVMLKNDFSFKTLVLESYDEQNERNKWYE